MKGNRKFKKKLFCYVKNFAGVVRIYSLTKNNDEKTTLQHLRAEADA